MYTWVDDDDLVPGSAYFYWVEDVSMNNVVTRHGPVSVVLVDPTAATLVGVESNGSTGIPGWAWWIVALVALGLLAAGYVIWQRRSRTAKGL